jgi:NAD(P)-dependent dehydrogenase (short-subunit alcohol dehydrogenase family)
MIPSKETTKYVVDLLVDILKQSGISDKILGIFVVVLHISFGIWAMISLVWNPVNLYYFFCIGVWLIIIYSNYFFHGCILSRVEREFFSKSWCGPTSLLGVFFNSKITNTFANMFIKYCIAAPISIVIILKLFAYQYKVISLLLFCVLTPLLFISSQEDIFSSKKASLQNKVIVITGCSSGLGKSILGQLRTEKAKVYCLNRTSKHNDALIAKFPDLVHIECDLTSFDSIRKAVKLLPDQIDILFNNAGVSNTNPSITVDGFETQIQTNFLSHVLLTNLLLPSMKKGSRIINHTSIAYGIPSIPYDSSYFVKSPVIKESLLESQVRYQQSKLAIILYSRALSQRNKDIKVICVHPGICNSDLLLKSDLPDYLKNIVSYFSSSIESGCKYLIDAMTKDVKNDLLYGPSILNFNSPSAKLVNDEISEIVYNEINTYLDVSSSSA